MNDFLTTPLQAVLVAAVPMCAAFIGKGLKALASYLGQKSENDTAKSIWPLRLMRWPRPKTC